MKRITSFLKKYFLLVIVSFISVLYIAGSFLKTSTPTPTSTYKPVDQIASYKSLVPGTATTNDLNKVLGKPVSESTANGQTTLEYSSSIIHTNHTAILENGKIAIFKEAVNSKDSRNTDFVTNIYGIAPYILYNELMSVFNLYVYPQNGIAYLGSSYGVLDQVWYFEPTDINTFISKWGQGYSFTPPAGGLH